MNKGVSIIIPTYNGGNIFEKNLRSLASQSYSGNKEIVIIDSGSTDGTYELALKSGALVKRIDQKDFHHSRTRNQAVSMSKYSKIVLLVQDAIPISNNWLSRLVGSIENEKIVAAYGQQIPHLDADLFARFEVDYHSTYLGQESIVQHINSIDEFKSMSYQEALRTIRFDNICAIYERDYLEKIPFPDVPYAEDIAWSLEIMKQGLKIRYQPEIQVYHSHNRSTDYRFRRSIIDTIVCSQLLEKVEKDLSSLTAKDLGIIQEQIKKIVNDFKLEISTTDNFVKVGVNSFIKSYLLRCINWIFRSPGKVQLRVKGDIEHVFEDQLRFIFQFIVDKYSVKSINDLYYVVDQVAASFTGRLLGEVYASYKLKQGRVPEDIEQMIVPYLRGV